MGFPASIQNTYSRHPLLRSHRRFSAFFVFFIALPILLAFVSCRQDREPAFHTDSWRGKTLEGKPVQFSSLDSKRVVLNFYSPTCQPCIDELPALNTLAERLEREGIPLYMVVESWPEAHGLPLSNEAPMDQIEAALRKRIQEDVDQYNIKPTIVLMHPDFKINNEFGLVTGTPETLIFQVDPFELKYNFIGPLSTNHSVGQVEEDSRLFFAYRKATGAI